MTNAIRHFLFALFCFLSFILFQYWQIEHAPQKPAVKSALQSEHGIAPLSNIPKERYIHIRNDKLLLTIDKWGGRIIKAELLGYPAHLTDHTPFALLDDAGKRRYFAQNEWVSLPNETSANMWFQSAKDHYEIIDKPTSVILSAKKSGLIYRHILELHPNGYDIHWYSLVQNDSTQKKTVYPIALLSRTKSQSKSHFVFQTFMGSAYSTAESRFKKLNFKAMKKSNLDVTTDKGWIAMMEHYFISAWAPKGEGNFRYFTQHRANWYTIGLTAQSRTLAPRESAHFSASLYLGPTKTQYLSPVAPHLNLAVDYGLFWWISESIFTGMKWCYAHLFSNWGVAIILMTIFIKMLLYPFTAMSYRAMAKMRKIGPEIQAIRSQYADDPEKMRQETIRLYREADVNPAKGCLPMLLQFPIFIALYWTLVEAVDFRLAPFLGWYRDLSSPDPYFVLPALTALTMLLQQRLSPAPPDPLQARMMMIMPLVFGAFCLTLPSGLVLYMFVNSLVTILQQWWIARHEGA